ncbi:hypothetical protein CR513_00937, partial [Mucuna pruriens]
MELEYEKVHNCKSFEEMWDTLSLAYEAISHQPKFLRQLPNIRPLPTEGLHNRGLEFGRDYALG